MSAYAYTNEEYWEMVRVYARANNSARLAVKMYAEQFPKRKTPNRRTLMAVNQHLREHGQFTVPQYFRNINTPSSLPISLCKEIHEYFKNDPEASTRKAAKRFGVSQYAVWREMNEDSYDIRQDQDGDYGMTKRKLRSATKTDTSLANKSETEAAVASLSDPYGFNIDLEEEKESNNESEPETDPEPEPENEAQPLSEELSRPDVYDYFAEALADELRSFPKKEGNKMMKKIKILMNRCKNEIDFYNSLKSKTEQSKSKPSDNKTQPKNTESKKKPAGQTTKTNDRASGNNEDKRKAPPTNTKKRTVEEEPVSTLSKKKQKTVPVNTEDIPQVSPEVSSNTAEHSEAEQRKAEQSKAEAEAEQREARYRYLKKYLAEKNAAKAKETPPVQPIQIEDEAEAEPEPEILPPPEDINPVGPDPLIVKVETTADVGNQSTSKVIDLVESEPPTSHIKTEQGERCDSPEEYVEITEKYPYIGQL